MPRPQPDGTPDDTPTDVDAQTTLVVRVVRSGGFAGLRREWRAEPARDEASHFISLIDRCPWDEPSGRPSGADRYMWDVRARCGDERHTAELADDEVSGPWRELIDAVREWRPGDVNDRTA